MNIYIYDKIGKFLKEVTNLEDTYIIIARYNLIDVIENKIFGKAVVIE